MARPPLRSLFLPMVTALLLNAVAGQPPGPLDPTAPQDPTAAQDPKSEPPATVTLTGRIVTALGEPIAGAAVSLASTNELTTTQLLDAPQQRTDAEGRFTFEKPALRPETDGRSGAVMLHAAAPNYAAVAKRIPWKYQPVDSGNQATARPAVKVPPSATTVPTRLDSDMGQVVLPQGNSLIGRLRTADDKPVAGATVIATDMLEGSNNLPGTDLDLLCRATSDKSGIFVLPATLDCAVNLDVSAPGYLRQQLTAVARTTPLELELIPSGTTRGRLIDAEGRPVADARITAAYERRGPVTTAWSGPDGSYELPLEYATRYRITYYRAQKKDDDGEITVPSARGSSVLLEGPQENLEIKLEVAEANKKAPDGQLLVRAATEDGKPVDAFRAAATWQEYAIQNPGYGEYLLDNAMRSSPEPDAGTVQLKGPRENESTVGIVRVVAEGFAPATVKDVEWDEPQEGQPVEPLVVTLVPEARASGTVVDEATGEPVAGAKVWAERRFEGQNYNAYNGNRTPKHAVETAADGAFELAQLGEGDWNLRLVHPDRPEAPLHPFSLEAEEIVQGMRIEMSPGAVVTGHITGIPLPTGTKAFLHPLATPMFNGGNSYSSYSSSSRISNDATPLGDGGSFEFSGIKPGNYLLVAVLPSPPRCGGDLAVPLEPFRVRRSGLQRDIDASEDIPGTITGRVDLAGAGAVPSHRLVVVAQQIDPSNNNQQFFSSRNTQHPGARSFVGRDGSFALNVCAGHHTLKLIDIETGIQLATSEETVETAPGGNAECAITAKLAPITIKLQPEVTDGPTATVDRVELRFAPKQVNKNGGIVFGGNADQYDQGCGLAVPHGVDSLTVYLPAGTLTVLARNHIQAIRVDAQRYQNDPLKKNEVEVDPDAEQPAVCVLEIGPPPEVPEKEPQDDETKG